MHITKLIIWFVSIDLPIAILKLLTAIVGPVVVTIALPFAKNNHLPKWASWWDNPDYGVSGNHAYLTNKAYNPLIKYAGTFISDWYWLVVRNPANGVRTSSLFSVSQAGCEEVDYLGKADIDNGKYGWQFVWAKKGWRYFTGFYTMLPYCPWFDFECRIGFKILPKEPHRVRIVGVTFIINPFKRAAKR